MSTFLFGSSLLAAFLGGGLALFAPCCITFLLPAYFASTFRQRRNLLAMTLVFAAGIALVLVPIALGLAALGRLLSQFHRELNIVGGVFLVILGLLALLGRGLMPSMRRGPDLRRQDALSVMGLGVYSGVASSCCTPVLGGVLTLSALSPTLLHGVAVGLAYVVGMVFPLLVVAYFYDERQWDRRPWLRGRRIGVRLGTWTLTVHSTNLISGLILMTMGVALFTFGITGGGIYAPQWQADLGARLSAAVTELLARLSPRAEAVLGAALMLIAVLLTRGAWRGAKRRRAEARALPVQPGPVDS